MVNRFTQRAQSSLNFSLKTARELGHSYVGTEHLLLGLLSEKESIAYKILTSRGAKLAKLKQALIDKARRNRSSYMFDRNDFSLF